MILEVAILNVRPGRAAEFEQAFQQAQRIISSMVGYVSHELQYQEWRRLLHHFYDPFPTVEHYESVNG